MAADRDGMSCVPRTDNVEDHLPYQKGESNSMALTVGANCCNIAITLKTPQ